MTALKPLAKPSLYDLTLVIPCKPASKRAGSSGCWKSVAGDEAGLTRLLQSIERQSFPKHRLEILIMREGNSEEARARGIRQAQGEIIGCLDADNQLLGFEFLTRMYEAARDPSVVGAYPGHYAWMQEDPPLNRYFALLGANDPLCWWLGKADRRSWMVAARDERVVFGRSIPTLGSNGFFVKRDAIQPHVTDTGHIDTCERMRCAGLATYAIVNTVIWHRTGDTLSHWLRKRYGYVRRLYFGQKREWRMVSSAKDWWGVLTFVGASVCVVPHVWVSIRGYRRVKDPAWFIHPLACFLLACMYTLAVLLNMWNLWWASFRHGLSWHPIGLDCPTCEIYGWSKHR